MLMQGPFLLAANQLPAGNRKEVAAEWKAGANRKPSTIFEGTNMW